MEKLVVFLSSNALKKLVSGEETNESGPTTYFECTEGAKECGFDCTSSLR